MVTTEKPAQKNKDKASVQSASVQPLQLAAMAPEQEQLPMEAQLMGVAPPSVQGAIDDERGGGQGLPDGLRTDFESRSGADFSDVNIHTGGQAAGLADQLGAKAFTTGNDIFFNSGQYAPGTTAGQSLIEHEISHVLQQRSGEADAALTSNSAYENLEAKADRPLEEQGHQPSAASGAMPTQLKAENVDEELVQSKELPIQMRRSPTEPSDAENAAEPTEDEKSSAKSAASTAKSQAIAVKGASQADAAEKFAKGEAEKGKAAESKQKVVEEATKGAIDKAPTKGKAEADKALLEANKGAKEGAKATLTGAADAATGEAKQMADAIAPVEPVALEVSMGAAPTGAGLEGATDAAKAKKEAAFGTDNAAADKAPASPEEDGGFAKMRQAAGSVADAQKEHGDPKGEAAEAQSAAVSPASEVAGQAQAGQVGNMEQAETPEFDKAKFKQALMAKIAASMPKNAEEADEVKSNDQMGAVKADVQGSVKGETDASRQPLDQAKQAGPDQGAVEPRQPEPVKPADPGAVPTEVGAKAAVPKPKGKSELETPMAEGSQAIDQQMADAEISDETLANSNEPEFSGALEQKNSAKASAASAPAEYRLAEKTTLQSAEADAAATATAGLQGIHAERSGLLNQVDGEQAETKSADEQKRAEVGEQINTIYSETQAKVDSILGGLDAEVNTAFDTGAEAAKKNFENYLEKEIDAFKEKRYGGWFGWAQWIADKFKMPAGINKICNEARNQYIKEMDGVIDHVASIISRTLTAAKAEVARGKERIQTYVKSLPEDLQQVGQDAAADIADKFSEMESQINDKQGELVDSLAQKYQENMAAVDAKLEETKAANAGLIDMALDKIGGVIKVIMRLKDMLLDVLARVADVVGRIIKDPIGFLSNLIDAVVAGFRKFVSNIGTHLKKGLISWLTGSMAGAGITIPENFDLPGIFQLVMDILGISFEKIMGKLSGVLGIDIMGIIEQVKGLIAIYDEEGLAGLAKFGLEKLVGAENMGHLMEVWNIFEAVREGGMAALWDVISNYLGDLKDMVLGKIQEFIS
ncbi:MAG: DUF4157 domain-containing protein, partial [Chloroflexota bacterium]